MNRLTLIGILLCSNIYLWGQTEFSKIKLSGNYSQIIFAPTLQTNTYAFGTKAKDGMALGLYGTAENSWLTYWREGSGDMVIKKGNLFLNAGDINMGAEKYIGFTTTAGTVYKIGFNIGGLQSMSGGAGMHYNNGTTIESDAMITFHETDGNVIRGWMDVNDNIFHWSGKVGIGIVNPWARLDVNGSTLLRNRLQFGNTNGNYINDAITGFSNGIDPSDAALLVPVYKNNASDLRLYITDDGNDAFSIWGGTCGGGSCGDLNAASQVVRFEGGGNVLFSGNVGIGKRASGDLKLDVAGTLRAEEILVEANGNTADFVFSDTYNLKDLTEVENYIKTHKHLPDIPSAEEMETSGIKLAEMNVLLLQKVEELTIYTIRQEEKLAKIEGDRKKEQGERKALEEALSKEQSSREKMEERLVKIEALLQTTTNP